MASSTNGARNQGSAWGALLKAHSDEKQRTEKNPSPLISNEQPILTINKKSPRTSPQPNSSPLLDPSLQANSDPCSMYRLGNFRVAIEEEDEDWVRDGESSPIPFSNEVLTNIAPSNVPKQQQLSLESTQLALASGADSLDSDKPILTGTGASSAASSSPPGRAQSTEPDGKYADWGAWHLQQLGTLQSIKQNTDSSPNDRNSFAYQLLAEKSDKQFTVAKETAVNQLEPTNSASIDQSIPLEPTQPEKPQKAKQKKKKEKPKEASPSSTTPVELNVQVLPPPPSLEAVSQPLQEFRAFNLPRAYLSSVSHDSNLSPPPSPNPLAHRAEQTSSAASKASTANAKSEETTKPKPASASTTPYNIASFLEKPSPKAEKPKSSSNSKTKTVRAPAAAAAAASAVPEWQSSSPSIGTFANDPVPQMDRATFPSLDDLRPSSTLSGPYAGAFLGQSRAAQQQPEFKLQSEPAESGLAALNVLQEREADSIVRSFEDWCLRVLADLHISSDIEVAADELHTLDSEVQVFLHVCLLVGQAKSALADEFSSTYLRKRMRIDLQRLRLRAEQRKRTRAKASATRMSAFVPRFNVNAASFIPSASSSSAFASAGSLLAAAAAESYSDLLFDSGSAADASAPVQAPTPKFKAKGGGKRVKGKPIDPSLLGFQ